MLRKIMKNERIIEKAVQIALDRGWEFDNLDKWMWSAIRKTDTVMNNWYYILLTYNGAEKTIDVERIIFDHDFARALFGNGEDSRKQGFNLVTGKPMTSEELAELPRDLELWKRRLQEMAIADDPIKYLGENI